RAAILRAWSSVSCSTGFGFSRGWVAPPVGAVEPSRHVAGVNSDFEAATGRALFGMRGSVALWVPVYPQTSSALKIVTMIVGAPTRNNRPRPASAAATIDDIGSAGATGPSGRS